MTMQQAYIWRVAVNGHLAEAQRWLDEAKAAAAPISLERVQIDRALAAVSDARSTCRSGCAEAKVRMDRGEP